MRYLRLYPAELPVKTRQAAVHVPVSNWLNRNKVVDRDGPFGLEPEGGHLGAFIGY